MHYIYSCNLSLGVKIHSFTVLFSFSLNLANSNETSMKVLKLIKCFIWELVKASSSERFVLHKLNETIQKTYIFLLQWIDLFRYFHLLVASIQKILSIECFLCDFISMISPFHFFVFAFILIHHTNGSLFIMLLKFNAWPLISVWARMNGKPFITLKLIQSHKKLIHWIELHWMELHKTKHSMPETCWIKFHLMHW